MTEKGFIPLTGELGISGTSYRIQLGLINEKWASRLLKGRNVIDSYVYKDEDTAGGFPNQNLIVGWVLRTLAIPNINPHQVMRTVQTLARWANKKRDPGFDNDLPLPFPFIPPNPPGAGGAAEQKEQRIDIEEEPKYGLYCKHCGSDLPKGQLVCHVCGKKVI